MASVPDFAYTADRNPVVQTASAVHNLSDRILAALADPVASAVRIPAALADQTASAVRIPAALADQTASAGRIPAALADQTASAGRILAALAGQIASAVRILTASADHSPAALVASFSQSLSVLIAPAVHLHSYSIVPAELPDCLQSHLVMDPCYYYPYVPSRKKHFYYFTLYIHNPQAQYK